MGPPVKKKQLKKASFKNVLNPTNKTPNNPQPTTHNMYQPPSTNIKEADIYTEEYAADICTEEYRAV